MPTTPTPERRESQDVRYFDNVSFGSEGECKLSLKLSPLKETIASLVKVGQEYSKC